MDNATRHLAEPRNITLPRTCRLALCLLVVLASTPVLVQVVPNRLKHLPRNGRGEGLVEDNKSAYAIALISALARPAAQCRGALHGCRSEICQHRSVLGPCVHTVSAIVAVPNLSAAEQTGETRLDVANTSATSGAVRRGAG